LEEHGGIKFHNCCRYRNNTPTFCNRNPGMTVAFLGRLGHSEFFKIEGMERWGRRAEKKVPQSGFTRENDETSNLLEYEDLVRKKIRKLSIWRQGE